jgi:hypothetical protein
VGAPLGEKIRRLIGTEEIPGNYGRSVSSEGNIIFAETTGVFASLGFRISNDFGPDLTEVEELLAWQM